MDDFRELYERAIDYSGDALYDDVLEPSIDAARALVSRLNHFRELKTSLPGQIAYEDLWTLFALSVVNNYLLAPLRVSLREYRAFFSALGFECFDADDSFSPVLCEIVDVSVSDWHKPEEGVKTGRQAWPGLRFGELIFSRCAVDVYGHPSHGIVKGIADRSVLYFTYWRMRRKTDHPAHGWGANSRWRSDFHRTYVKSGFAFLNADGEFDLATAKPGDRELDGISVEAAAELLLHRSFVRFPEQRDQNPYDWKMAVENATLPWPQSAARAVPFEEALALALRSASSPAAPSGSI